MLPLSIKRFVAASINNYKFRKYRAHFETSLTDVEKTLVLPFLGFLLKPEVKVVYDIGAATGEFATALAKQRNVRQVCAFEPLPGSWRTLAEKSKGQTKIACYNTALGEQAGTVKFFVTADGDSSSCLPPSKVQGKAFPQRGLTAEIDVPVATLDGFVAQHKLPQADVVIMDVQGYELHVLRGAANCLSGVRFCILECCFVPLYDGAPLVDDIWAYMKERGWRVVGMGPQHCDAEGRPIFMDLVFERAPRVSGADR
jgi:FkbM family methyltransferase